MQSVRREIKTDVRSCVVKRRSPREARSREIVSEIRENGVSRGGEEGRKKKNASLVDLISRAWQLCLCVVTPN